MRGLPFTFTQAFFGTLLLLTLSACSNKKLTAENEALERDGGTASLANQAENGTKASTVKKLTNLRLKFTNGLRAILEDSRGHTWFGSHNEGLALLRHDSLVYFTTADGLSDNQIRNIYEDQNGTVWFECGRGLSLYADGKLSTFISKMYPAEDQWTVGPQDLFFKGDEASSYNQLEEGPGVYHYNGQSMQYRPFPQSMRAQMHEHSVSSSYARTSDRIWFGTYSALVGYDGNNYTVIDNDYLGFNAATGYLHIRSLYADSRGNLWIGNNGIGVLQYDGQQFTSFTRKHGLYSAARENRGGFRSDPGTLEHVFAIGEDSKGNIWFGDRDTGAWCYDGKQVRNYGVQQGLPVPHIWQIYLSKSGALWFAMGDGSVQRFDGERFERVF